MITDGSLRKRKQSERQYPLESDDIAGGTEGAKGPTGSLRSASLETIALDAATARKSRAAPTCERGGTLRQAEERKRRRRSKGSGALKNMKRNVESPSIIYDSSLALAVPPCR